jgi:PAS domain S-box-containing protein
VREAFIRFGQMTEGRYDSSLSNLMKYTDWFMSGNDRADCVMSWLPDQTSDALAFGATSSQALRFGGCRYRGVVENQTEMICRFSPEHRITFMNPAMAGYFGLDPEQAVGERLWDLVTGSMYDCLTGLAAEGKAHECREMMYATPDGEERWLQWSVRPVQDVETGGEFQAVGTDMTTRKCTELALSQANKKLNLLCSITRHDVRNQLAVCFGHLELLRRTLRGEEELNRIAVAAKALGRIRDQVEFTTAYQSVGASKPQWLDAEECFVRAVAGINTTEVKLDIALDRLEVFADPMLERVFYNLMDNSLRHGINVSAIDVHYELQDHWLVLLYGDNGVGVAQADKERLFGIDQGNVGHGLFLAKEILGMTGLAIYETGLPGEGVRFEILVPPSCFRFSRAEPI